jgi:hypothetical protein
VLAHGCPSPFDPVRDYVSEDVPTQDVLDACPHAALVLLGHTHERGVWHDRRDPSRCVVNVGAVGDPGRPCSWLELVLDGARPVRARWSDGLHLFAHEQVFG